MSRFPIGTFSPAPGRGRLSTMLVTQVRTETALTLRNGEQILLTILIPLALLGALVLMTAIPLPAPRQDSAAARVFALAVMSSAFTGQAIALGFDRRYGVFKRLATTALPRWLLVIGRVGSALMVVAIQVVILGAAALAFGWRPSPAGLGWMVLTLLVGTLSFGALGVVLGGALRAEIVLAVANIAWVGLLLAGGIALAGSALPQGVAVLIESLPSAALAQGLHSAMVDGIAPSTQSLAVLAVWGLTGGALAFRTTKLS